MVDYVRGLVAGGWWMAVEIPNMSLVICEWIGNCGRALGGWSLMIGDCGWVMGTCYLRLMCVVVVVGSRWLLVDACWWAVTGKL